MISKHWFAMVFALASAIPSLSHAQVTYEFVNGAICQPNGSTDVSKLIYNTWGVANVSSTQATVMCPVGYMGRLGNVRVTVYDRNTSANVCCTIRTQAEDGSVRWASPNRCSSGFGSNDLFLDFGTPTATGILTAVCTIPASTSNGSSHIASFRFSK